MDQVRVRTASSKDIAALLDFEQGVIAAERPFDTTLRTGDINYYDLQQMIDSPDVELVVAELNDILVASGYARIENAKSYLAHEKFAYLGFMYVVPEYRGQGINQKIIRSLTEWAASKNIHELRLEVYIENASAIKAYEKIGFSRHMVEMRMNTGNK
jgi:ribosomal protein S18 acetylase RimI-like enzyme